MQDNQAANLFINICRLIFKNNIMYFKRKSNIIFRNYGSFGYITDNRNFGYNQYKSTDQELGDKILSESGAAFFSVLSREAVSLSELAKKLKKIFPEVNLRTLKKDAGDFYLLLEQEGFVVFGETIQTCNDKDVTFSYEFNIPKNIKHEDNNIVPQTKETQDFFEEYFHGVPQLTNLHIEITSRCNERCVHCYIPHEFKANCIDVDLFYKIVEQCKEMRLLHLTLTGGEPMLHKNFIDFLHICNEYNFSVNVLSNLTLLSNEIIKEMKSNPLLGVQVSLYSMDANIHDQITQLNGSFEKTINAILKLVENDIPVQISCPILKQNQHCINDVRDWANKHKINLVSDFVIIGKYDHNTQNLNCRLSIDEIEEVIIEKLSTEYEYFELIEREAEKKRSFSPTDFVCSVCHSSICISEKGNVYPCAGWQSYILGNIKDDSLNEIWANSNKVKYLRELRNHDFPKCLNCVDREFCTMCMVRNANEDPYGNPLVVNEYFCKIAKLNRELVIERKRNLI